MSLAGVLAVPILLAIVGWAIAKLFPRLMRILGECLLAVPILLWLSWDFVACKGAECNNLGLFAIWLTLGLWAVVPGVVMVVTGTRNVPENRAHYFRRYWHEPRGDQFDSWGLSVWLYETDGNFWPRRQIVQYDSGVVHKYDRQHPDDQYGGLAEQPLDPEEFSAFRIERREFESAWRELRATNR